MATTPNGLMNAAQGMMNSGGSGYGGILSGGTPDPYAQAQYLKQLADLQNKKESAPNRTTITIEDASNGQIIRIGNLVRLAPSDENLVEHIGAAYTQYKLEREGR